MSRDSFSSEKRAKTRYPAMTEHMVEFNFAGFPIYLLKAKDISQSGIGVIVRSDSKFLNLVEVGQEMSVKLLTPDESLNMRGIYKVRVAHITPLEEGKFKGHELVALKLLSKMLGY